MAELSPEYVANIVRFIKENKPDKNTLAKFKVQMCKELKVKAVPTDIQLFLRIPDEELPAVRPYIQTKPVRTKSGVVPIALMTRPERCPHGVCTYCPGGPGSIFGDVPQSYTGKEPSTMRSIRGNYDPYIIVSNRIEQFVVLGHEFDKCDVIIQGGTFCALDCEYQEEFVTLIFKAMNDFSTLFFDGDTFDLDYFKFFFESFMKIGTAERIGIIHGRLLRLKNIDCTAYTKEELKEIVEGKREAKEVLLSLEHEQKRNESSKVKCIGLTIETKPDWAFLKHGNEMLRLGVTRIELGVQTVYDDVLQKTHRGHSLQDTITSIRTLKDLGFKLNFHMMLGLPGVSKEEDLQSLKEIFDNSNYRPDMLKMYPCMVMPGTALFMQYKKGEYTPLTTQEAADIIIESFKFIPEYCRIMRINRDIPTFRTEAGIDRTNLRQFVDALAQERGVRPRDIRTREITNYVGEVGEPEIKVQEYESSEGTDFFISAEFADHIMGFARLRFPSESLREEITAESAIIRELHVYGQSVRVGKTGSVEKTQHKGIGKKLMSRAEQIAGDHQKKKMLVISGVGVRAYYYKLGYVRDGPYVSKYM